MDPLSPLAPTETLDDTAGDHRVTTLVSRPRLFLVLEADRPLARGVSFALDGVDEILFGRSSGERIGIRSKPPERIILDVRVPSRAMSTRHARIMRAEGEWVIEDSGSRNGTFVNGERVERRELQDRDVIQLGSAFFILRQALPTPALEAQEVDGAKLLDPIGMRTLLPALRQQHEALRRIARSAVPVLLLGDTGTGKELVARAVHSASGAAGAFVAVNCGALPATLVESLLFGHTKGAFSGAHRDELGFVRSADGGTLFLDEIGDLPALSQAVLLRVLQEREVVPVGSTRPVKVDVRVIAATHRPLDQLVSSGGFRSDLLARLKGFTHHLLPLQDRLEDMGVLVGDVLEREAGEGAAAVSLSTRAARAFFRSTWPHNVRELAQCLVASVTLAEGEPILPEHLPAELRSLALSADGWIPSSRSPAVDEGQLRDTLHAQLEEHRGNVAAVARSMGKAPMQIHRWMKRFGIDPNRFRG